MRNHPGTIRRSSEVTASSLRALTSVGFVPLGVVIGNSTTHIARAMSAGGESRISNAARSFASDDGTIVPNPILRQQARHKDQDHRSPAPFLAAYPCPHFGFGRTRERRHVSDHLTGYNWELPGPGAALQECFESALTRLLERAEARGAHGVVDVHVDVSGDSLMHGNMGITLTGTAICVPGTEPLATPFVAGVSCQAFSKLLGAGLVPFSLSFGVALLSSWTGCQTQKELESGFAKEVNQLADVLSQTRDLAVARVYRDTNEHEYQVMGLSVRHGFGKVAKTDYRVGAWACGTVLRRFAPKPGIELAQIAVTMEQR